MDTKQAAKYLGVSEGLLKKLRGQDRGPTYIKIEQRVVYLKTDLDDYFNSCRRL
jgi:hypothetical protein